MAGLNGGGKHWDPARERIGLAAVDLIGDRGLEGTGVDAVCERAQVSRGHFDRCFADLEDCFLSFHAEVEADFWARLRPAYEGAVGWHDRIWAAGWAMMRFLRADPPRARFLIVAVNGAGGDAQARRDCFVQRFADLFEEDPRRKGRAGRRSRCTAEIAAGAVYRMLLTKVMSGSIEREEEFLPELVYMAVMPYLGAEAAEGELAVQPLH